MRWRSAPVRHWSPGSVAAGSVTACCMGINLTRLDAGARGLLAAEERVSGHGPAREHERVERLCWLALAVG